ncbi:MAG: ABC-F family ATP-binding cassette domain-containing protein [Phycisphaerales bacterium]|nr:ABC-F family ATP-binding cassette domain-containing protein [Phycisphaerales bacterium]
MGLIRFQDVTKQFGGRVVLDGVSVEISSSEHVGLVGPNGAGKSTLLRLINGTLTPDIGSVTLSKGMHVGTLEQEPRMDPTATLHDEVLSVFAEVLALEARMEALTQEIAAAGAGGAEVELLLAEYDRVRERFETAGGYRYESRLGEILGGLGFGPADAKLPVSALSGGQRCRAALAKLLLDESEFLLLDEPTNHLDIDAVRWLEKFLAGHHGGALIISHDRYLLDRACDRILEIDRGRVISYPGNYSNFVRTRDTRRLTQQREFEKDREFIEKERDFIARHMGSQRTAEARGRRTRLERRIRDGEFELDRPHEAQTLRLRFGDGRADPAAGHTILEIKGLSKGYDGRPLFDDLTLRLDASRRLGITGPNGVGKTTLLNILTGRTKADRGEFALSRHATLGWFGQDARELDPDITIVQALTEVRPDLTEATARSLAGGFLFSGEDAFKTIGQLSGGEQSRVRLLRLMLGNPNVLILDEPTNHLDIASREVLEAALCDFTGTIIAVSHDRYFLDRVCGQLLVLRPDGWALHRGNYTTYIESLEAAAAGASDQRSAGGVRGGGDGRGVDRVRGEGDAKGLGGLAARDDAADRDSRGSDRASDDMGRRAATRGGGGGGTQGGGASGGSAGGTGGGSAAGTGGGGSGGARPRRVNPQARKSRFAAMSTPELEAFIETQEQRIAELNERFGDPALYQDRDAASRLEAELHAARGELEQAEEEWAGR